LLEDVRRVTIIVLLTLCLRKTKAMRVSLASTCCAYYSLKSSILTSLPFHSLLLLTKILQKLVPHQTPQGKKQSFFYAFKIFDFKSIGN